MGDDAQGGRVTILYAFHLAFHLSLSVLIVVSGKCIKSHDKICGVKVVTHFTKDLAKVKQLVTGLQWPRGSTLTSLALLTAKAELALGEYGRCDIPWGEAALQTRTRPSLGHNYDRLAGSPK